MADQAEMVHRLPRAELVERVEAIVARCQGKRVVHVGFADVGFREMQERTDDWLHASLDDAASSIVGLDIDDAAVDRARSEGYEAFAVDCSDPSAVASLGIAVADVVVAGEIIEHLDSPGPFLRAMADLVGDGGELIITTPNASGFLNSAAALVRREVNHPDHLVLFSWRTLATILERNGWHVVETYCYVPEVKAYSKPGVAGRVLALGGRAVVRIERVAARLGAPFFADGLMVVARRKTQDA